MIELFNAAMMVNQSVMRRLRDAPELVRSGLSVLLFVGLLVGAVNGASQAIANVSPERTGATIRAQVAEVKQQLRDNPNAQPEVIQFINNNEEQFYALVDDVLALPTPLPRQVGVVFQWLNSVVSTPLSYLAGLLVAVVFTHIAARQLGGTGNIRQMVGLGALSTAPHALDALAIVPVIGPTLGTIAWAWGLVILVVATMVAHQLDSGKATIAVLLFPLVGILLGVLAFCGLLFMSAALAAGV
jgi:hypothetical protein